MKKIELILMLIIISFSFLLSDVKVSMYIENLYIKDSIDFKHNLIEGESKDNDFIMEFYKSLKDRNKEIIKYYENDEIKYDNDKFMASKILSHSYLLNSKKDSLYLTYSKQLIKEVLENSKDSLLLINAKMLENDINLKLLMYQNPDYFKLKVKNDFRLKSYDEDFLDSLSEKIKDKIYSDSKILSAFRYFGIEMIPKTDMDNIINFYIEYFKLIFESIRSYEPDKQDSLMKKKLENIP